MKAIGVLEVAANVAAIEALDAMLKAADVSLVTTEKALGGRLVSLVIEGSVSDVKEALEHGKQVAAKLGSVAAAVSINSPHEEVQKIVLHSARKLSK
jgi:ethanolamine utilization protein EutM